MGAPDLRLGDHEAHPQDAGAPPLPPHPLATARLQVVPATHRVLPGGTTTARRRRQSVFRIGLAKKAVARQQKALRRQEELAERERQYNSDEARRLRSQFVQVVMRVRRPEVLESESEEDDEEEEVFMLGGSSSDEELPSGSESELDNRASGASGEEDEGGSRTVTPKSRRDSGNSQAGDGVGVEVVAVAGGDGSGSETERGSGAGSAESKGEGDGEDAAQSQPEAASAATPKPEAPARKEERPAWEVEFRIVWTLAVMPWGWAAVDDGSGTGDVYYYNHDTGETLWERPEYSFKYAAVLGACLVLALACGNARAPWLADRCQPLPPAPLLQGPAGCHGVPGGVARAAGQAPLQEGARQVGCGAAWHRLPTGDHAGCHGGGGGGAGCQGGVGGLRR